MTVEPFIVRLGSFELSAFGMLMLAGFAAGAWTIGLELGRRRLNRLYALDLFIAAALGGILGAKAWYAVLWADPGAFLARGGMVFWGGLAGGIVAVVLVSRWRGVPPAFTLELCAPAIALAYAIGRVGCFLVGDDYGVPTSAPWGVKFPRGLPPTTAFHLQHEFGIAPPPGTAPGEVLAVHPTQLYEAAIMLLVFAVLWRLRRHPHGAGWLFGLYLVLAGAERFAIEFLRAKDDRLFGPLTLAQLAGLAAVLAGAAMMKRLWPPDALTAPGEPAVLRPEAVKVEANRRGGGA